MPLFEFVFHAIGDPKPQGSKKGFLRGNKVVMVEANPKLAEWRKTVALAAVDRMMELGVYIPFQSAVSVHLVFYMPKPKTVTRMLPSVAPDLDKLCRSVLDSCTTAGVWTDDSLVVNLVARKEYAVTHQPSVWVKIVETPPTGLSTGLEQSDHQP